MGSIQESIDAAVEYLREHPDEARYRDGAATATAEDGLRVVVSGTTGESVATDMVTGIGGGGTAPSPGWLFRAAQASCVATLIRMRAEMLDVDVGTIQVTVDSESDDRGILGIDPDVVAGPLSTRIVVRLGATELPSDAVEAIVRWAVDHGPVTEATTRSVPMEIVIEG